MSGETLRAGRRRDVIGRPIAEIVAGFLAGMEYSDVLITVAREQALRLGVGPGRVADQHTVLGRDDRADARNGRLG
ncbi:hypothetical protein MESS4_p10011 [Mesorhizobium sp. STM 4661]|nr:hypothetical protein MESS4_p10011 [Mesorhizobium sp. STM 4661]